jgi:electron transfer flavoprotein alpha subunit
VLVAGQGCQAAADAAAKIAGVAKVLLAEAPPNWRMAWPSRWRRWSPNWPRLRHMLAPATTFGKNVMPRVAALLDVAQISEIMRRRARHLRPPDLCRQRAGHGADAPTRSR